MPRAHDLSQGALPGRMPHDYVSGGEKKADNLKNSLTWEGRGSIFFRVFLGEGGSCGPDKGGTYIYLYFRYFPVHDTPTARTWVKRFWLDADFFRGGVPRSSTGEM